jgi:hypothetical protein
MCLETTEMTNMALEELFKHRSFFKHHFELKRVILGLSTLV